MESGSRKLLIDERWLATNEGSGLGYKLSMIINHQEGRKERAASKWEWINGTTIK